MASSSSTKDVEASACTTVTRPGIDITKSGTPKQKIGKRATYAINVSNPGDLALDNLTVTDNAPEGTRIIAAPDASISGNTATWKIAKLQPGGSKALSLTLTSKQKGTRTNVVCVKGPYNLSDCAEAPTEWIGIPALLLELIDTEDALLIGDKTTYVVRITNQGTAQETNLRINLTFPPGIKPLSASGASQGTVSGGSVSFKAYPVLKAKEVIEFRIPAEAAQEGDNRVKVQLESDLLSTPIEEDESTTVY